ncbi:hypothetical protein E4U52_007034 [Claviceps spartinae]|nr:hypothetical protein E4U52_007034 [Claviceps spartinae]
MFQPNRYKMACGGSVLPLIASMSGDELIQDEPELREDLSLTSLASSDWSLPKNVWAVVSSPATFPGATALEHINTKVFDTSSAHDPISRMPSIAPKTAFQDADSPTHDGPEGKVTYTAIALRGAGAYLQSCQCHASRRSGTLMPSKTCLSPSGSDTRSSRTRATCHLIEEEVYT